MIELYIAASVLTITLVKFWPAKQSKEASRQKHCCWQNLNCCWCAAAAAAAGTAGLGRHAPKHNSRWNQKLHVFGLSFVGQKVRSLHMRFHAALLFSLKTVCTQGKASSARFSNVCTQGKANSARCSNVCTQGKANSARSSKTIWQKHPTCWPVAAAGAAVLLHGEHSRAACHGNHCCHLSRAGR